MIRKSLISLLLLFSLIVAVFPVAQPVAAVATAVGVSPPSAKVGDKVRFTGSVTQAGDRYELYWDNADPGNLLASGVTVTSVVSAEFTVPESPKAIHAIILLDIDDRTQASLGFTVTPAIQVDRISGPVGTKVNVSARGFAANESGLRLVWDSAEIAGAPNASAKGSWNASFDVPVGARGNHTVGAYGAVSPASEVATSVFTVVPTISINPSAGAAGSQILVNGSGFAQLESAIAVLIDGNPVRSDIRADAKGAWSYTYTLPAGISKGNHTVGARGGSTLAFEVPEVTFSVAPNLRATPDTGTVGTRVTVYGTGFAPGEREINVTIDGALVKEEIAADANGAWTTTFDIPARSKGKHAIRAGGSVTPTSDSAPANFTIAPKVGGGPLSGPIGTDVTISGSGLDPNRAVSATFDGAAIGSEVVTSRDGSFEIKFKIPQSKSGQHAIVVKDASGNLAQLTFNLSSDPPKAPEPVGPDSGVRFTFFGGATPTFEWSSVASQGGAITYTIEISQNPDFSKPVISKSGLNTSSYTVTSKEALDRGTYYWRVRATDAIGNQSGWTASQNFDVGVMALWVLILIIVGSLAVVGGIAFFLLRRRGGYNF